MRRHSTALVLCIALSLQAIAGLPTAMDGPITGPMVGAQARSLTLLDNLTVLDVTYPGELDPFNYSDVLVLVNNNSQMSKDIGEYFAEARGIPPEHVAYLDVPARQNINDVDLQDLLSQVKAYMIDHALVNRINYIVTTKGFPLSVYDQNGFWYNSCVDEELALLFGSLEGSIGGYNYVPNPYYGHRDYFSHSDHPMYIVNRLTGYNWSDVKDLIDHANETYGNRGLFVLDIDPTRGFPPSDYGIGNYWIRNARDILTERQQHVDGIDILYDETRWYVVGQQEVIGYASWGSNDANDTDNAKPHNTWVNGSIAETIVSTGGRTFNWPPSYGQSLIADLVREGVTGVKGYVQEPFLDAIAEPDILFERYTAGFNLAESYRMASVKLGWMGVVVGDPKVSAFRDVPDLVIDDSRVLVSNLTPATEDDIEVRVDVDNRGGRADNVTLELLVDNVVSWSGNISFDTFGRTSLSIRLRAPSTHGEHELVVRANPTESVFETLTSNNLGKVGIDVRGRPVITLSARPSTVLTQEGTSIQVNVTNAPRNVTTYYYDFGDGTPLHQWTKAEAVHEYEDDGTYVVTVHVIDDALVTSHPVQVTVVVNNRAPFAAIDVVPATALSMEPFAFDSYRSGDLDGSIVVVEWDLGDGNTSLEASTVHAYALPGDYKVTLTVRDDDGMTASTQRPVSVLNRPPVAAFMVETANVWKGRPVTLNGSSSSDPDGRILQYEWAFGDGSEGTILRSPWVVHTFIGAGLKEVTLTVYDDFSALGTVTVTVEVLNELPVANLSTSKAQALTLERIDLDAALSSDPDGSLIGFAFTVSHDGADPVEVYSGDQTTAWFTPLDDDGGNASTSAVVVVLNRPPTIALDPATLALAGKVFPAPTTLVLAVEATDADGVVANVTWLLDDVPAAWGAVTTLRLDRERGVRIRVVVQDDDGASAADTFELYVNEPPSASFTATLDGAPLPVVAATVRVKNPLVFDASSSSDAGGSNLTFIWDMGDGTTLEGITVEHAFLMQGVYVVRLTVQDTRGGTTVAERSFTVSQVKREQPIPWTIVMVLVIAGAAMIVLLYVLMGRRRNGVGKGGVG